jgi:hypothetical protein
MSSNTLRSLIASVSAETGALTKVKWRGHRGWGRTICVASATVSLKAWKKYRIALSRLGEQVGFPENAVWPEMPGVAASYPAMSSFPFPNGPV